MAISASSSGKNRVVKSNMMRTLFESAMPAISSACTFNQGDLLKLDTGLLKPIAANTEACVGVAPVSVVAGVLKGPYQGLTDVSPAISDFRGPEFGGTFKMKLHLGDAFNPGDLVYPSDGDDCQTVTSTGGMGLVACGVFVGPAVAAAAAGEEGECLIGQSLISAVQI